jgi:hypothetical protein
MKSFTISPPPGDPPTLQNGTGTLTFTVTNTATRTVDGTVLAKPQPPAEESWFTFPEGATRTYQPGAVQSVSATITAPPGTPNGTYTFRLDAKAEDNPDEDYTEGPSAQFVVAEAPKPPPWWKRYWWIAVIVAVVLIGIVVAVLLLSGDDEGEAAIPERGCVAIDPNSLAINETPIFSIPRFTVSATGVGLGKYASRDEADRVTQLARAFERRCVIGNVDYWLDETGQPLPEALDCVPYDPGAVEVQPSGARFTVRDPQVARPLGTVTTQADADDLKAVAAEFTTRCFIGQGEVPDDDVDKFLGNRRAPGGRGQIVRLLATSTMDYWVK